MSKQLLLFAAALIGASADPAAADCTALLASLQKADAQHRVAQYEVERADARLPPDPAVVRVGKVEYIGMSVGGRVTHYEAHDAPAGGNPVIASLRRAMKEGSASCENAGNGSVRGIAADKIRLDNRGGARMLTAMMLWVDKQTGLPLYHEIPALGVGYAWAFGDDVKEPTVRR